MITVYKYPLESGKVEVSGPIIRPISVMNQNDNIVLYCEIDSDAPPATYSLITFGTGFELKESELKGYKFLGTVIHSSGAYVQHVYYKNMKAAQIVPYIEDNGFCLTECPHHKRVGYYPIKVGGLACQECDYYRGEETPSSVRCAYASRKKAH